MTELQPFDTNTSTSSSSNISVSDLIEDLCKSLYKDVTTKTDAPKTLSTHGQFINCISRNDQIHAIHPKLLRKCKVKAFEVLLKKSRTCCNSGDGIEATTATWDAVKEFKFSQFEWDLYVGEMHAKFHAYGHVSNDEKMEILKRKALFAECLDFIEKSFEVSNGGDGGQDDTHAMLQVLLELKNFQYKRRQRNEDRWNSFISTNSKAKSILDFSLVEPKYFQLNLKDFHLRQQNPYLSKYSLGLPGMDYKRHGLGLFTFNNLESEKAIPSRNGSFDLRAAPELHLKPIKHTHSLNRNIDNRRQSKSPIFYVSKKWEHLGKKFSLSKDENPYSIRDAIAEKSFISEFPEAMVNLMAIKAATSHALFQAHIVPLDTFIAHLKSLLIGIESDSFQFDAAIIAFGMVEHLTVANISPPTMDGVVKEFIESGTCYRRLKMIIGRNVTDFKLRYDGFLFKALCGSLDKYLETFRRLVIFIEDRSISELLLRIRPMLKQIRILARILAIHPNDFNREIPRGSEFLGYLYKQIINVTQRDVSLLLVFILSECCDIYFRNFENWIFHGIIDDPSKELFIEFINHYRVRTKFYFDKAHVIKKHAVPGFLQGYENSILLCGKYVNLLKLYNPTHPLLSVIPPSISVCLSFNQLQATEMKCNEYKRLARTVCGDEISITNIFRQRDAARQQMAEKLTAKFQLDIEKWRMDRESKAADAREQREKERLILLEQIQESRELKIQKRREQLRLEQEYLRESEMVETELLARENAERQKTIEYYKELGEIVDSQRKRAETEMKEIQKQLDADDKMKSGDDGIEPMAQSVDDLPKENATEDFGNATVYFDANSSPEESDKSHGRTTLDDDSPVCNENYKRRTQLTIGDETKVSTTVELPLSTDRPMSELQKNRASVLESNIKLSETAAGELKNSKTNQTAVLTAAQQNKLKVLQQEYDFQCIKHDIQSTKKTCTELTDLQRNRERVMSHEFGFNTPTTFVAIPDNRTESTLEANRRAAQSHDYNFNELPSIMFTRPSVDTITLTDLQRNRLKVLGQEYNIIQQSATSPEQQLSRNARNKLKSSFSLELNEPHAGKSKQSVYNGPGMKQSRSTFDNTPMSTTSDENIGDMVSSQIAVTAVEIQHNLDEKGDGCFVGLSPDKDTDVGGAGSFHKSVLRLDTNLAQIQYNGKSSSSGQTTELPQPTPESALNTAGLVNKQYGFLFDRSPTRNHSISQIIRPTFSMTNFFDISSQLTPSVSSPSGGQRKSCSKSEMPSLSNLRHLNIANLTNFLQQSFILPLQAHLTILNNEILKIYLKDFDVLSHFHSLRNYFFMMDGEFASNISDGLLTKLHSVRKPGELLNSHVLHSILENALHSSIIGNDKNAENLSFFIPHVPDEFDMASPNVLRELHLSYKVEWPLNLLLSTETIEHYSLVFQHLIKLRRLSWLLEQCFYKLKDIRKQSAELIQQSPQYRHVQHIRHKLSCFINALQTHITSVALQGSWQSFQQELETVKSMEDLYKKHTKYLKRVKFLCMLNKKSHDFFIKMEDVFVVVLRFCYNLQSKNWRCDNTGTYQHPKYPKLLQIESDFSKLIRFIIYAGQKMFQCGYQTEISEFIYMININGYYDNENVI